MKKAAATLMTVLIVFIIALLIVTAWQARLLNSVRRQQSLSDLLIVSYRAETTIYDWVAKFSNPTFTDIYKGAVLPDTEPGVLLQEEPEPNKLRVLARKIGDTEYLDIVSARPFASTKMELSRQRVVTTTSGSVEIQLMLALDCTGSMNEPADSSNPLGPTRFDALEDATVRLLDRVEGLSGYKVGLVVFEIDSRLVSAPTSDIAGLRSTVVNGFNSTRNNSPICNGLLENTSVGSGMAEVSRYFAANPVGASVKRAVILMTDGETNSTPEDSECTPAARFCPVINGGRCDSNTYGWSCVNSGNSCAPRSRNYLTCKLATAADAPGRGTRDPNVDVYAVTVLAGLNDDDRTIYEDFATEYFPADKATELPDKFDEILTNIQQSIYKIEIRKPTP